MSAPMATKRQPWSTLGPQVTLIKARTYTTPPSNHTALNHSDILSAPVCADAWRHLQVASCSPPLRAHPAHGRCAHALCVTLLDELKVELHVVVRHRVRQWRRVAEPGRWCAVAGLLPAPFQHNARVWRTCASSRVRPCAPRGVRAHLSPRAWQEQHLRTRAGRFVVARRLRSGDLVLRAQSDGAEFLLVTYFSSRIASLPRIPLGALVSLHGATCLGRQGVLAMCARTDLRVVEPADDVRDAQTFPHETDDGRQTFRAQRPDEGRGGRDEPRGIVRRSADGSENRTFGRRPGNESLRKEESDEIAVSLVHPCGDGSVNCRTPSTGTRIGDWDSQENVGETSYLNAISALFRSPQAEGFNSESQLQEISGAEANSRLGVVSDVKETSSHTEQQDGTVASTFRVKLPNTRRFFDESPRLYRPARKPPRILPEATVEGKTSAFGSGGGAQRFPMEELEDEGPGGCGAVRLRVEARNLAQYLWYLDMVVKFRGRFGDVAGSGSLEVAVAKLLGLLNSADGDQDCDEAVDAYTDPHDPRHCLADRVLSDCFSDDHACPLVAGAETSFAVHLGLESVFQETLQALLERSAGSGSTEQASVSERLRNVVGILEVSPDGFRLFRQPRFDGAALRRRNLRSDAAESDATVRHFDSGFQSQEDSPAITDSDFQSHRNSHMIIDNDSQSQLQAHSFTESPIASQSSSQSSVDCGVKCLASVFPRRPLTDETEKSSECFAAVVMNAECDAAMNGRLVLLAECRLVAERGTAYETPAGLWLDSQLVQDLGRLRLPCPPLPPPPTLPSAPCPLCADAAAGAEHCDERWDPDLDSLAYDPGSSDPGSWDPRSSDPGTWDSGTCNPGTGEPGTWDPGTWDPGTGEPGTCNPGSSNPGTWDPGTWDPGTLDSGTCNPGSSNPGTWDPGTWDPGTGEPGTWDSGTCNPGTWDSGTGGPDPSPELWDSGLERNGNASPGRRDPVGDRGTETDVAFVASSLATRHRFVLHSIAATAVDGDGRRSCLLLTSLVESFAQPTPGRLAVLALHGAQLRWLPLLRERRGYCLRGCVRRVPDVAALAAYRTRCDGAALERHDCAHEWRERTPRGMRSLDAKVVAVNVAYGNGGAAASLPDSAWLDVCADGGDVLRLYLRGWARRCLPRALLLGANVRIACVRERTSVAGRWYLHPTPLTSIRVVSLGAGDRAWWDVALPPVALPGATMGLLPPRCVRWALAAARCTRCNVAKRTHVCDRCGLAGPGRARVTLRLCAAAEVDLIAVDEVAAVLLGYTALGWQTLTDWVSRTCGAFEWAGPDDEMPEDRDLAPCVRRFYAACRTQPTAPTAVRCRGFKGRDGADVRFALEVRKPSEVRLAWTCR